MKKAAGNPDPPVIGDLPKKNRRNSLEKGPVRKAKKKETKRKMKKKEMTKGIQK